MSDFMEWVEEMEDTQGEYESYREPQWVSDMLNTPWVTELAKNGDTVILDKDGVKVATINTRLPETRALTAAVICDYVNKI